MGGNTLDSLADLVAHDVGHSNDVETHLTLDENTTDTSTDTNDFAALPLLFDAFNPLDWRREVKERGKYWQWRKGSGEYRPSRYGGTFGQLDEERQAQYGINKRIYGRDRKKGEKQNSKIQARRARRGAGNVAKRPGLLPDQRRSDPIRPKRKRITPTA